MKQKKKILLISNLYPSSKTPYYGSFVRNFKEQLIKDRRISKLDTVFLKGYHKNKLIKLYLYFLFYLKIIFFALFFQYDFIYVHLISHSTLPLRLVNAIKPLKIIFNIHGEDLLVTTRLAKKLLSISMPTILKAQRIVVPSYYFKGIVEELMPKYNQEKVIVSPSAGINDEFYVNVRCRPNIENFTIGYVSRIDRGKGWKTLLIAINDLKRKGITPNVLIVGEGPQRKDLEDYIQKNQLYNVIYKGPIPHDQLPDFYCKLDIFIFPTELRESLGLVGIEAMAAGVPVIGSKIGGLNDYIMPNYNGFLFKPGSSTELSIKILKFLNLNFKERELLSNHARKTAEKYRAKIVAELLFDQILN